MAGFTLFREKDESTERAAGPACDCGQRFADKVLSVLDDAFSDSEEEGAAEDKK